MTQAMSVDVFLEHFGVKGMRWGVRKSHPSVGLAVKTKGITMRADGSIDIKPGANLQRLVRSSGKSMPMKDMTYASINDYDNTRYIKTIGGKGFFGGGRDQVLSIKATKAIKAPSHDEATRIVSEMMLTNSKFREKNTSPLGLPISNRELKQIKDDPGGKTAKAWYDNTNVKFAFNAEYDWDAPYIQKAVQEKVKAKGYNALRDENDVKAKLAKAPIIIFNPETSLRVVKVTDITNELRSANKEKLKQYKQQGQQWVESELYN